MRTDPSVCLNRRPMRPSRTDLGTFAHGQFRVDYEHRPDPYELREVRVERARAEMKAAGLDALLLWKDENVRYLTGLRAQLIAGKSTLLNGCLLPTEGPPVLLASGGEVQRARVVMPWIEEIHAVPIMEAVGLVRGRGGAHDCAAARAPWGRQARPRRGRLLPGRGAPRSRPGRDAGRR